MNAEAALLTDLEYEVGVLIDPETGEITANKTIVTHDLPKIARIITALQRHRGIIEQYMKDEIERIAVTCTRKTDQYDKQIAFFIGISQAHMEEVGEKKLMYPGIGTFRWRKLPDKVNTDKFDELEDAEKRAFATTYPDFVRTKVDPNRKEVMTRFKAGTEVPNLFTVQPGGERFEFKEER